MLVGGSEEFNRQFEYDMSPQAEMFTDGNMSRAL